VRTLQDQLKIFLAGYSRGGAIGAAVAAVAGVAIALVGKRVARHWKKAVAMVVAKRGQTLG
jgi:thioesterase domain-containing protein